MRTPKFIPTIVLIALLSIGLAGCGGDITVPGTPVAATAQPTSAESSRTVSAGGSTDTPTSAPSSADSTPTANTSSGPGTVKLSVVKYIYIPPEEGGLTGYYMGIVKNEGTAIAIQLQLHVLDETGKDAGAAEDLLTEVHALRPGQSAGFRASYSGDQIKNPQFKVDGQSVGDAAFLVAKLTVLNQQPGTSPDGFPTLNGEVRNDGDKQVDLWQVNIIAYDAGGNIVDVNGGSSVDSTLPAHATGKFHSMMSTRAAKATKYDVLASGQNH